MLWVVIIYNILAVVWIIEVLAIPFEEGRERFFAGVIDGELDGIIDFVARTDAFERFSGVWVD